MLEQWTAGQNLATTLPIMQHNQWEIEAINRLYADSSGANKGFILKTPWMKFELLSLHMSRSVTTTTDQTPYRWKLRKKLIQNKAGSLKTRGDFIKSVKVYSVTKCFTVKKYNFHKQIKTEYKIAQSLICSSSCPGQVQSWSLGFAFDHWIDPVDIAHHFGVNTRFSRAPAAFTPADDPIQEADITPRTGQRASRVTLRKHTSRDSYKHTRTDQSGATQTADSHTWNLIYELNK